MARGRLSNSVHQARPWRIHEFTSDFRLEDVWALQTPGGKDDFPRLVELVASIDPAKASPLVVRALFAMRLGIGRLFGWDERRSRGDSGTTIRDRLPADLRDAPLPAIDSLFTSLYMLEDEFAAEIVNRTVHAVMHLGWVSDASGGYRGEMAVLVKPNGVRGSAYMAAIKPFRHIVVYPWLMRALERRWDSWRGLGRSTEAST